MSSARPYNADVPDEATRRLATILVVVAALQAMANLAGVGATGVRVDFVNLLTLWAAVALRNGRPWGRMVLLALALLGLFLVFGFLLASDIARNTGRLLFGFALVYTLLEIVALAYTLPEEGVSFGLPEAWRRFATSPVLHALILVAGLVGVFTP